jgi:hypothetical protein
VTPGPDGVAAHQELARQIDQAALRLARLLTQLPPAYRHLVSPSLDALAEHRDAPPDWEWWRLRVLVHAEQQRLVTAGVRPLLAAVLAEYAAADGELPEQRQQRLRHTEYERERKRRLRSRDDWLRRRAAAG